VQESHVGLKLDGTCQFWSSWWCEATGK
jgi:hypothetical protein